VAAGAGLRYAHETGATDKAQGVGSAMNSGMNVRRPNSDEWETPFSLFYQYAGRYGITIDVAASEANHKMPRYYDKAADGLAQSWDGEVAWCNPPYSQIALWTAKARTYKGSATTIMLLPVRTDTIWFHRDIWPHANILFLRQRVRFLMNGVPAGSPGAVEPTAGT